MFTSGSLSGSKPEQYEQLLAQARALVHGERDRIANAAAIATVRGFLTMGEDSSSFITSVAARTGSNSYTAQSSIRRERPISHW